MGLVARGVAAAGPGSRKEGPMSEGANANSVDLLRWTFTADPAHRAEIEGHLHDLGLDVLVRDDCRFVVLWDEPEGDTDEVIEELWTLNGAPFEVIQEELHRLSLLAVHHEDAGAEAA
jgi:hypothetical protein